MTSVARIAANRANARKSTGPKTASGKARVSRNARRHGLSSPKACAGLYTPQVEALAREIAGQDTAGERLALAGNIAAAQLDLARIRIAKRDLQDAANFGSTDAQHPCDWSVLPQLERLDRYEQRVFTRRRRAIREFCKTKPMLEVVPPETSAPEASEGIALDFCKTKPIPAVDASASVPGENVSDNFCRTNPTYHVGMNPTPPQEVTAERFCKTKPSDANADLPVCAAPTLSSRAKSSKAKSSKAKSSKAKQFLQNKANRQRCKEYKTGFDGVRAPRFGASWPSRAWIIPQSGPTFIRGP